MHGRLHAGNTVHRQNSMHAYVRKAYAIERSARAGRISLKWLTSAVRQGGMPAEEGTCCFTCGAEVSRAGFAEEAAFGAVMLLPCLSSL